MFLRTSRVSFERLLPRSIRFKTKLRRERERYVVERSNTHDVIAGFGAPAETVDRILEEVYGPWRDRLDEIERIGPSFMA